MFAVELAKVRPGIFTPQQLAPGSIGVNIMKFAVVIEYGPDKGQAKALHSVHREYLRGFLEKGQLFAAGPFADDAGALWVLEADSVGAIDVIVQGDPYAEAGLIKGWKVYPLLYWSSQEFKGK